jgi:hypothetical protein
MEATGDNFMTNIILSSTIAQCWGLDAVMPTHSFMQPGAFEPEAIAAMSEAYDAAFASRPNGVREAIARRIIAAPQDLVNVTLFVCGKPRSVPPMSECL